MMRFVEHRERGPGDPFENLTLRFSSRQDSDAKQHAEQKPRRLTGFDIARDRLIRLPCQNAFAEECFNISKLSCDDRAAFRIVRCHLKRRVHKKATFALPVLDRMVDNLGKEAPYRFFRP